MSPDTIRVAEDSGSEDIVTWQPRLLMDCRRCPLRCLVTPPRLAPTEAARPWAALLQQIFEVDPLACPRCRGTMRILAFITQTAVIDQILAHPTHGRGRPA